MAGEILTEQFEVNANFCDLSQTVFFKSWQSFITQRPWGQDISSTGH